MEHNATIIDGSQKVSGTSLVFKVRCCNDPTTDYSVTIANAGRLTPADVIVVKGQQLAAAAERHAHVQGLLEHLK